MNVEQWRKFLNPYSIELLNDDSEIEVSQEVYQSQWMGYQPATETQIVEAEKRLGVSLPNSLRNFYLVTNGWRETGHFIYDILPLTLPINKLKGILASSVRSRNLNTNI